jgi:phytoene synthase
MTERTARSQAELAGHYAHCGEILRDADRDAWLAALFAPAEARRHIHTIYAFAAEIGSVRARVSQPLLGEMRLRWHVDALEGSDGAGAHAHPVMGALLDTIERFGLPRAEFVRLLEARRFDLYDDPMPTLAALEDYCRATAAQPMAWAARILGEPDSEAAARAIDNAGIALGLAKILRAPMRGAATGPRFVPADLLARGGAALEELRRTAQNRYESARLAAADMGAGRAALLPASVVPLYLTSKRRDGDPPLWRRQWRMWRAARGVGL